MRISHREIDECVRQPRRWLESRVNPTGRPRFGYKQALLLAIHRYHTANSAATARSYLQQTCDRNFENDDRIAEVADLLDSYITWCEQQQVIVADTRVRLTLRGQRFLILGGEVSRVDIIADGYRAVLLQEPQANWKQQIRMPLIQVAVARKYGRPENEIQVAVQDLDGSGLTAASYSRRAVAAALDSFRQIENTIERLAANYPEIVL